MKKNDFDDIQQNITFFWLLLTLWTIASLGIVILQFLNFNDYITPKEVPWLYGVLAFVYTLLKHFKRSRGNKSQKRKGEYYIYLWWTMALIMLVIEFISQGKYKVPERMTEICYAIIIPFIVSLVSKYKKISS